MTDNVPAYGLWGLTIVNAAIFIMFAFSFFRPRTRSDWRTFGTFSAFIVALFVEMYGFPLTLYLLAGWLQSRYPGTDILTHDTGHLWYRLLGFEGDPHLNPIHLTSDVFIISGFFVLASSWRVLLQAQQSATLAVTGPYRHVRHPQYVAFILIMFGFLLQWPTVLTVTMFPVLVTMYVRLAHREERDMAAEFGEAWDRYASVTPGWWPRRLPGRDVRAGRAGAT